MTTPRFRVPQQEDPHELFSRAHRLRLEFTHIGAAMGVHYQLEGGMNLRESDGTTNDHGMQQVLQLMRQFLQRVDPCDEEKDLDGN